VAAELCRGTTYKLLLTFTTGQFMGKFTHILNVSSKLSAGLGCSLTAQYSTDKQVRMICIERKLVMPYKFRDVLLQCFSSVYVNATLYAVRYGVRPKEDNNYLLF
jgi:hypothetical protein